MSDDLELILDLKEAQKEITTLRERLGQAERERAHWRLAALMSRREGFRAGIEAAAKHLESDCPNWRDDIRWAVSDTVDEILALAAQKGDE